MSVKRFWMRAGLREIVTGSTVILLLGCGGGGGGGGGGGSSVNTAPIAIDTTNAPAVAATAYAAGLGASDAGRFPLAVEASMAPPKPILGRINAKLGELLARQTSGPQTVAGYTEQCPYGGNLSVNDSGTRLRFDNCSFDPGEWMDGSITISDFSGTEWSWSAQIKISLAYHVDGLPDVRFAGTYNLSYLDNGSSVSMIMSGPKLSLSEGTETTVLLNYSLSYNVTYAGGMTTSGSFTVASNELGGSVTVAITGSFQIAAGTDYPHTGSMTITGTTGTCVLTVLDGTQVRLEVDADGNGNFEWSDDMTWSELFA